MNFGYIHSNAERLSLETTRRMLGTNLSYFLLSGIGETLHPHSRFFTAQSNAVVGERIYRFKMVSDSDLGLPSGKDPLVLAALLSMISAKGDYNEEVVFNDGLIIEALSWPASPDSRMTIERAIERYVSVAYYMISVNAFEQRSKKEEHSHFRRLLAGYQISYEDTSSLQGAKLISIKTQFIPGFLRDISTEHKFFLGIDFESLTRIQELFP